MAEKGNRKLTKARETAITLLVGLAIMAGLGADAQLYFAFVIGVTGADLSFMHNNSKEHQAAATS